MHPALQRPRRFSFVSVARQRFLYQVSLGVDVPFYGFDRVRLRFNGLFNIDFTRISSYSLINCLKLNFIESFRVSHKIYRVFMKFHSFLLGYTYTGFDRFFALLLHFAWLTLVLAGLLINFSRI